MTECILCATKYDKIYKCSQCTYELCLSCAFYLARVNGSDTHCKCPQCRQNLILQDGETLIPITLEKPKRVKMYKFGTMEDQVNLYEPLWKDMHKGLPFKTFYETYKEIFPDYLKVKVVMAIAQDFKFVRSAVIRDQPVLEFQSRSYRDGMYDSNIDREGCVIKRSITTSFMTISIDIDKVEILMSEHSVEPELIHHHCLVCAKNNKPPDAPWAEFTQHSNEGCRIRTSIPKHLKSVTHLRNLELIKNRNINN